MSATTETTNGRPQRKQLSDQLDRLDVIIDALAEALPEAVADAAREGTRQAVKDAIVEILSNPDLRNLVAAAPPPATPAAPPVPEPDAPKPGFWARARAKLSAAKDAVVGRCQVATATVAATARALAAVMPLRKILLVGTGVGLAVGLVSYACPHGLSAAVSAVGGACTAVAAQVGVWFRRSTRLLGFGGAG
jgi:hypothetical protein